MALSTLAACGTDSAKTNSNSSSTAKTAIAKFGCANCHSIDGSVRVGPTWKGLAGSKVELEGGSTVTADNAYLHRAITDPDGQRVKGFSVQMPKFQLTPEELDAVVTYIRSLK